MSRDVPFPPGPAIARARRRERGDGGRQKSRNMFRGGERPWARLFAVALLMCGASVARAGQQPCNGWAPPTNGGPGDCYDEAVKQQNNQMSHGASCTPTCNTPLYEMGSTTQASCNDGTLTNVVCSPVGSCTDISDPTNGWAGEGEASCAGVTVLATGKSCLPACDDGFELLEGLPLTCAVGQLSGGVCTALSTTCTTISDPTNGWAGEGEDSCAGVTALADGRFCVPDCNAGYSLSTIAGQTMTSCSDGNLTKATCVQDCTVSFAEGTGNPTLGTEVGSC